MKRKLLAAILLIAAMASPAFAQYTLTILASFNGTDGNEPLGGLILSGSTLYGTTMSGGANGVGEVFSLPTTGGTPTVLASFIDNGTNGASPEGGLVLSGSTLYGTTSNGGITGDKGTVFSVPVTGGTPTVLASFNGSNGANPRAGLVLSGSTLYGTTYYGGATFQNSGNPGDGEAFSLPTSGGTPTILASFNGTNGFRPAAGLIVSGSTLYGTTTYGGATFQTSSNPGDGEVFSLPTSGGAPTVLTSFNGANGTQPSGGVILSGSTLYGTTTGLSGSAGEVFSLPTAGGEPTVLAPFNVNGTDGTGPDASLLLSGGTVYGTAIGGGTGTLGTVFSVPTTGGTPTVLASFNGANGSYPEATLIMDASGNLYGTTAAGGTDAAYNDGTVFELSPTSVPEATSASLFAIGSLAFIRRRARRPIVC